MPVMCHLRRRLYSATTCVYFVYNICTMYIDNILLGAVPVFLERASWREGGIQFVFASLREIEEYFCKI
uniref:Uncharacterized protein n=1 Tax=Pararge aegeria TaxID=116150 RepID=S4NQB4_9NEOP